MLIWVTLMGAGVVGGFLMMALAAEEIVVPVAVVITGLSVVTAVLAAAAVIRLGSTAANVTPRPAHQEG